MVVLEPTKDLLRSTWGETVPQLTRLIRAIGIDEGRQEDVLQEVFLAAWQKSPISAGPTELRRWLIRVTVNRCKLEQRHQSRWRALWQKLAAGWSFRSAGHTEPAATQMEQEGEMVRRSLARISPKACALLVLRYFMEFDSAEIGHILGVPSSTVRRQLCEARKRLAWELKREGYHCED